MLKLEVKAIVDKVLDFGDGDILVGKARAVEAGIIDVPFSTWDGVKGNVLPVADRNGCVRWLEYGNIPLPKEVIEFHQRKIAERERIEGRKADVEMLIEDIRSLVRWQLDPSASRTGHRTHPIP